MVNTLGFLEAVSLAKSTPSLGVGLHFNLTYGTPATNPLLVPSLVGTGGSFHGNHAEWTYRDIAHYGQFPAIRSVLTLGR